MENSKFIAKLEIIGINPFVFIPDEILNKIFEQSGKNKSPIPVKGFVNDQEYRQNLMKYLGEWRLYVNLMMLKNSPKRIGEMIDVSITFDDANRSLTIHPDLDQAIKRNPVALKNFEKLIPSHRNELIRYIDNLKTESAIKKNIEKIISHLKGETDFFGKKLNN